VAGVVDVSFMSGMIRRSRGMGRCLMAGVRFSRRVMVFVMMPIVGRMLCVTV
jgi:hypothetical protein